jgi:hypothetical protein
MDLKTMVNKIPFHLMVTIKNVRLSPAMGYHSANFESLLELKRWLVAPASDQYRLPGDVNVSLETLLAHSDKPKPRVIEEIRALLKP